MLSPDFILHLSEKAEAISEQLHNAIVRRIVARFLAQMQRYGEIKVGATSRWQMQVLREAGYLYEDIQKEISAKTQLEYNAIKEAFETAGLRSYNYDSKIFRDAGISTEPLSKSPYYMRMLESHYRRTNDEWRNYTRTTADQAQVDFINACDNAFHQVNSGAISYSEAVADAVEQIGSKGVEVTYPSGHRDTLETATLRAVRTGTAQACAAITDARMDENDWDIILVSAHLGARVTKNEDFTNHAWWQGKFYSKSGRDPRFLPFSVCGKGDVQGINGANCRHSYGPGDGVFNPYEHFDNEENKKAYELSQRQRAMERRIRKTKRELMALKQGVDDADDQAKSEIETRYREKAVQLKRQYEEYNSFCKDNGLKRLDDRMNIAELDKKQVRAATTTVSQREKALDSFREKMERSGFRLDGFENYYGDTETLEHMESVFERMSSIYPDEASGVTIKWDYDKEESEMGWYTPKDQAISINRNAFESWDKASKLYADSVKTNNSPKGTDANAVFFHEFGHRVWDYRGGGELKTAVNKVLANMGYSRLSAKQRNSIVSRWLSEYAVKLTVPSYQEVIAESFAEWYNSNTPRKFCEDLLREVGII